MKLTKNSISTLLFLAAILFPLPSYGKGLSFWKKAPNEVKPIKKCEQPGMMLTQRCACEELVLSLNKLKATVNTGKMLPKLPSLQSTFDQLFLIGRSIEPWGNLRVFKSNKQCEIFHWQLETLKFKILYFNNCLDTLKI